MKGIIKEFKEFAVKSGATELAIGVVLGSSFTSIVNSFVTDLINPLIGLVTGKIDLVNRFIVLSTPMAKKFKTLAEAKAVGATTLNYGSFLNAIIQFFLVALVIFLIIKLLNRWRRKTEASA